MDEDPTADGGTTAHQAIYTVVLNTEILAGEDVGIEARSDTPGAVLLTSARTPTPRENAQISFFPTTWNTAQTVTVHAQSDATGMDEEVTISHRTAGAASNSGYYTFFNQQIAFLCPTCTPEKVLTIPSVTVSVADKDTPGLVVDTEPTTPATAEATPLRVTEEDPSAGSAPYTVALATAATGEVTVAATVGGSATGAVTVAPATLTFTTSSWNTARTVTASAAADANGDGATVTLTHTLTGAAEYAALAAADVATVTVQVADDDAPGLALSRRTLTVTEEAATAGTYTVALHEAPSAAVEVTVTSDDVAVTGAPATLTFTANSWNTAQTVTVRAGHDADGRDDTVALTHAVTSSDGGYDGLETSAPEQVPGVTVTVRDNDPRGITLDAEPTSPGDQPGPLAVTEPETAVYTVRLATQPVGGTVTVTVAATEMGSATGAVTVQPAPLLFTAGNWNTARTVTATAADDQNTGDKSVTLTHTAVGGDYPATPPVTAALTVAVTDDDMPGLAASVETLAIAEPVGGSQPTGQYTVRLNTAPAGMGAVTVGITQPTPNTDIAASPTALTFATST